MMVRRSPGASRLFRHPFAAIVAAGLTLSAFAASAPVHAASAASVLPPVTSLKGWKAIGAPRMYNSRTLYNLIDGEAEAVLQYAFAGCVHAEYAPVKSSRPVLTVDVFDMSDPLNAFGLFGSDRISGKPIAIGAEGVQIPPSGLNFWKGRYVVRTAIVQVNPANKIAQLNLAKAIAAKITGGGSAPPLVKALPPGRQPRSEKYVRANVAGQSFLKNAITARYPSQGQGAELFIAQYPSPLASKSALAAYKAYEKRMGTGLAAVAGLGESGFKANDRFAKNVIVGQKGRFLVGMHHAKNPTTALSMVRATLTKVK